MPRFLVLTAVVGALLGACSSSGPADSTDGSIDERPTVTSTSTTTLEPTTTSSSTIITTTTSTMSPPPAAAADGLRYDDVHCTALPADDPRVTRYPVADWFVPPTPTARPLLPSARVFFAPPTRTAADTTPTVGAVLGPGWDDDLRAVEITDSSPFPTLTVVGRLDRASGSFSPLVAVDGCALTTSLDGGPTAAVTTDGTGWVLVRANGEKPELLRIDPAGGGEVVASWRLATNVIADGNVAYVLGLRRRTGSDAAPGHVLVAPFTTATAPDEPTPFDLPEGHLISTGGRLILHECSTQVEGPCDVHLLDPADVTAVQAIVPAGWSVIGRTPDGVWLRDDDTVELRGATTALPTLASFPIDTSAIVVGQLGNDWTARLAPDGWVLVESVLRDGQTILYERLAPDGTRQEIGRLESQLAQHSREYEPRLAHPRLVLVPGGIEYGEPHLDPASQRMTQGPTTLFTPT